MNKTPVSVALCTFNGAKFIAGQIESVLSQLGSGDELVVSDDHSDDLTMEIIESYKDSRIRILQKHPKKLGVVGNFLRVLAACQNEYIFLCDQDDIWLDNRVKCYVERMLSTNAGVVIGELDVIDQFNEKVLTSWLRSNRHTSFNIFAVFLKNPFIGCGMLVHRRVIHLVLTKEMNVPMHDWWIGLCAIMSGERIEYISDTYTLYRRHQDNASPLRRRNLLPLIRDRLWLLYLLLKMAPRFVDTRRKRN